MIRNILLGLTCILTAATAIAECPVQKAGVITANPNRPTTSDPADITQYGVAEVEYGFSRTWDRDAVHSNSLDGLFKFAVLCDLELRWTQGLYESQAVPSQQKVQDMGDHWVGAQYRFHHQTTYVPTLAFRYETKIPFATTNQGLGSGKEDNAFTLMASKDIKAFHFDFNAEYLVSGRQTSSGHDQSSELALAFSHALHGPWGITGEIYGDTHKNADSPAFLSNLWGITYTLRPRFVIDAGVDVGITSGARHKTVMGGFTYSLGDFSPLLRSVSKSLGGNKPPVVTASTDQRSN